MFILDSYTDDMAEEWDKFCKGSYMSTMLHERNFLSYHGSKFSEQSIMIRKKNKLVGVFPAACGIDDDTIVVSHPGATYGGIIHQGELSGINMLHALELLTQFYSQKGFKSLIYKVIPNFYHSAPAQDDLYALFRLGGQRIRCDLSATIDLSYRLSVSKRRVRSLKKSISSGVKVSDNQQHIKGLWHVLSENLSQKHDAKPVHNLNEILLLKERYPDNIKVVVGLIKQKVVSGIVLFNSKTTCHAQYIASSSDGYKVSALDTVFEYAINWAGNNGFRYFDFGISNEDSGMILNEGLFKFKSEFGAGSTVHEFYELNF